VPQITDLELIRRRLEQDRYWNAYAIADLEPEHFRNSVWFVAPDNTGLTLLYRQYSMPLVFCAETTTHLDSILAEIDVVLGQQTRSITVSLDMVAPIRNRYNISSERALIRMVLERSSFRPVEDKYKTTLLTPVHLNALKELYRESPQEFFLDSMITEGVYYGIFEEDQLVAVAGTHILTEKYSIGVLGNIYTRADRRNLGYASSTTSAVTKRLLNLGIEAIVLNVLQENHSAIRVYERLGYRNYSKMRVMFVSPQ
jgi:RimJ/RimL family protein N-acetyltransferase